MKNILWRSCGARGAGAQSGALAVELALILALVFVPLLFGLIEFGRLFYVADMAQEVTRRAARAQVVRWASESDAIRREAVMQCADRHGLMALQLACQSAPSAVNLLGSPEIGTEAVTLDFFHSYPDALAGTPPVTGVSSPQDNLTTCLRDATDSQCIQYVRASLDGLVYRPMSGAFGTVFAVALPPATVIMPAEALGLR